MAAVAVTAVAGAFYVRGLTRSVSFSSSCTKKSCTTSARNLGVLGDAYGRAGRRADANALAAELLLWSRDQYVPPIYNAMIAMGLGDHPRALDWLERAYDDRSDWIMQLNVDPEFDSIRAEPRFKELLRRAATAPPP